MYIAPRSHSTLLHWSCLVISLNDFNYRKGREKTLNSRGPMDSIELSPLVAKHLALYRRYVRPVHGQKDPQHAIHSNHFFVDTRTGRPLAPNAVTAALQRNCAWALPLLGLKPTSNSLRHVFATLYWTRWNEGTFWQHIRTMDHFLRVAAMRLGSSERELRRTYINEGLIQATSLPKVLQ